MSSPVRFAAWMPAMRATASTSPFGASPAATTAAVSGRMRIVARATARLRVTALRLTSTIRAVPSASRCVRRSVIAGEATPRSGIEPGRPLSGGTGAGADPYAG